MEKIHNLGFKSMIILNFNKLLQSFGVEVEGAAVEKNSHF